MDRGRVRGGGVAREGREGGSLSVGRSGNEKVILVVSEVVSPPYTNSVCVGMEVSCKQSVRHNTCQSVNTALANYKLTACNLRLYEVHSFFQGTRMAVGPHTTVHTPHTRWA